MPEILFFPHFGPGWRSHRRVVEVHLDFSRDGKNEFPRKVSDIRQVLIEAGVLNNQEHFPAQPLREDRISWYSGLLIQTALLLQQKAGHRVGFSSVNCQPDHNRCTALMEHEDSETGMAAVELVAKVVFGHSTAATEPYERFFQFARNRVLPLETDAIIRAARRADVPCFQLEREPLTGQFDTGPRVRPNGLISLGHGVAGEILDGTFCVSRADDRLKALLRNPRQRLAILQRLAIPVNQSGNDDEAGSGRFHLLVINEQVTIIAEQADSGLQVVSEAHSSYTEQALAIHKEVAGMPLVISLLSRDISKPLTQTGGCVLDFDLAPDLERFPGGCEGGEKLLGSAAEELINWLFPDKRKARMPVVAVTGTNGKTTTCRMINHIQGYSGRKPGLVSTDGIFLNGRQVSDRDAGAFIGHARVLTNKSVDVAVLEAHHRGMAIRGFAFDKCNVAVCLNVTEEHIEMGEIESVEQMTRIKRSLLEQASDAAVLFADDLNCLSMLGHVSANIIVLVSLKSDVVQLRALANKESACFCVVEFAGQDEWLVFYAGNERFPVMPVKQIPATFNGAARFNVSNAMHALAASYLLGTDFAAIRKALSKFSAGQALTPGRMNVFDGLPFRIIMDFAHNPDGMQKVCEFVDRQNVSGRKLIAFSGLSKRSDDLNRKSAQSVAGHFDFYFCKDIEPGKPPKRRFTGPFMQQVLIDEGVPREATRVLTFGREVMFEVFDACEPGDLLLLLVGLSESRKVPGYIQEYGKMQQTPAR